VKKAAFWGAVAGVSLLSHAALELVARYVPAPGLQRLVQFIHCGPGGQ
jgi:hypothetical protein